MVSALIMPRSATTQIRPIAKRRRSRSITGISVVTSATLPGHISEHTGRPSPSIRTARIIWRQVRAMVLAVAVAAEGLPAGAFEVETGGVHEHQVEPAEEIAPVGEQPLLDQVLGAARGERRARVLLLLRQFFAEPRHRPVEMVELQRLGAGDSVVLAPTIGRQIRAAPHQPVQHGEEDRPLERELVPALPGQVFDHRPAAGLGPQALEHQGRPDPPDRRRRVVLRRGQHHRERREARPRAQQPLQLPARLGAHPGGRGWRSPAGGPDLRPAGSRRSGGRRVRRRSSCGSTCAPPRGAHTHVHCDRMNSSKIDRLTWHYILSSTHPRP